MEMKMKMKMIVGMMVMWMVVDGEAAVSCGTVASTLSPCISYLEGGGGQPPAACCDGVKSLNSQASSTADRRIACNCLKTVAKSIAGINYAVVASLPSKCGLELPYSFSPSTDCSTVN